MSSEAVRRIRAGGRVPSRVAIIRDGRSRGAGARELPRSRGDAAGETVVREGHESVAEVGIHGDEARPFAAPRVASAGGLDAASVPHRGFLILASGEERIGHFIPRQLECRELRLTPILLPDPRRDHLVDTILDNQKRDGRFGRVTAL